MTLSILRNTHKSGDIAAFLGAILDVPADSPADLARIYANKIASRSIEDRVLVLAVISEAILAVERQEMTVEVAAMHIQQVFAHRNFDPTWLEGGVTLVKNR